MNPVDELAKILNWGANQVIFKGRCNFAAQRDRLMSKYDDCSSTCEELGKSPAGEGLWSIYQ